MRMLSRYKAQVVIAQKLHIGQSGWEFNTKFKENKKYIKRINPAFSFPAHIISKVLTLSVIIVYGSYTL